MGQGRVTFFLAHAGRDTEPAKELRNHLHPDVSVFLDACDLVPGDQWDVEFLRHQRSALATIVLLSSATETAYYLRNEINNAIAFQRHDPATHRLIPVWLDGVPTEPSLVPYGIRGLHALDVAKLGMRGVAAELRRTAAVLSGADVPALAPEPPVVVDRIAIFETLCRLRPSQFEEVVFRVGAPTHHLAPATDTLARRALDLVQWGEQEGNARMTALDQAMRKVAGLPALR